MERESRHRVELPVADISGMIFLRETFMSLYTFFGFLNKKNHSLH